MVRRAEHPDTKPGRPPDGGVQIGRDNNGPLITGSVTGNVTDSHDVHYHLPPVPAPDDGPIVLGDIPAQPIAFQPRDDLVELVADARVAVLCPRDVGPGVGKTHVAAAYARRCAAAGWCLVGWLDASSLDAAALGLAGLAQHFLGVPPHEDVQTTATRFRDWLATHGDQTLLVLDNADSADTVRPFIPTTGTCHVVITTRDQKLAAQIGATAVEVGEFSPQEGLAFLQTASGIQDEEGARAVGDELGWLPLALAQAASRVSGIGYDAYRKRLRQMDLAAYLTRSEGDEYPHGAAEAILLSIDHVIKSDRPGRLRIRLLELISVLSEAGVSRWLLHACLSQDNAMAIDEAIDALRRASLVAFSDGSGTQQRIIAHRLVMRVIRERADKRGQLLNVSSVAMQALVNLIDNDAESGMSPSNIMREMANHISALNAHIGIVVRSTPLEQALLPLRSWSLSALLTLGASRQAIAEGELLVRELDDTLGLDNPATLRCRSVVAIAYRNAGLLREAIARSEQLLADCIRVFGNDDVDTLTARDALAIAYQAAGRLSEAATLSEQLVADFERKLGPEDPLTLAALSNLGIIYSDEGRINDAIGLDEQVLTTRERILDPKDSSVLTSRNNLATDYRDAGRLQDAIRLGESVLNDRVLILGPDHPDTLESRSNLALYYQEAGRVDESIRIGEQVLADRTRILGPYHPATLQSSENLAVAYQVAGRVEDAIRLHEQVLPQRERVLGPHHPDTLQTRNNLAVSYGLAGRLDEAIALYEQTLADRQRVLGTDHPDTKMTEQNLACTRAAQQQQSGRTSSASQR